MVGYGRRCGRCPIRAGVAGCANAMAGVLAVPLAAAIAGARSFVAIAEWAADAAPGDIARLGVTGGGAERVDHPALSAAIALLTFTVTNRSSQVC